MKRNDAIEIHFVSGKPFRDGIRRAIAKRKPLIQTRSEIFFETLEAFRSFMTTQKVELLTVIATANPKTIYELAKTVDRNFPAVLKDCNSLQAHGFIVLKETNNAKGAKKPSLIFPYKRIIVNMPHIHYQIAFQTAA